MTLAAHKSCAVLTVHHLPNLVAMMLFCGARRTGFDGLISFVDLLLADPMRRLSVGMPMVIFGYDILGTHVLGCDDGEWRIAWYGRWQIVLVCMV